MATLHGTEEICDDVYINSEEIHLALQTMDSAVNHASEVLSKVKLDTLANELEASWHEYNVHNEEPLLKAIAFACAVLSKIHLEPVAEELRSAWLDLCPVVAL